MRGARQPRKFGPEELYDYAVRCLGAKAYSSGELKSKLRSRAESIADADAAIERLKEVGYLDDRRFAESFASTRVENAGFGRMRVVSDLRARRVPGGLAERAADQALAGHTEAELIRAWIERRMPLLTQPGRIADDRELAKAWRRLRRAGFTSGAILACLKERAKQPELLEGDFADEPGTA